MFLTNGLSRGIYPTLLGALWIAPFVQPIRTLPVPSFYSEWITFVIGFVLLAVPLASKTTWQNAKIPQVCVYMLAVLATVLLLMPLQDVTYNAQKILPAIYLMFAILIAWLGAWLRETFGKATIVSVLAWALLVGGTAQATIGFLQSIGLDAPFAPWVNHVPGGGVYGNIGQKNHFATYLALAVTAAIYLYATNKIQKTYTAATLLYLDVLLVLSGSRSAIIYVLILVSVSIFVYYKHRSPSHIKFAQGAIAALLLFVLCLLIVPAIYGAFDGHSAQPTILGRLKGGVGIETRLSEWHKAWLIFLESPLFGVGLGSYGWHSFEMQSLPVFARSETSQLFTHSHNLFAQTLAELGLVGTSTILATIIAWAMRFRRNELSPETMFIGLGITMLFFHSMLEFPLWYAYFLAMFALLLGIGDTRTIAIRFSPVLGVGTSIAATLLTFSILITLFGGFSALSTANILIQQSPTLALQSVTSVRRNVLLEPWAEVILANHGTPSSDRIDEQAALTERVMKFRPTPLRVYRHITYLALANRSDAAIDLLNTAAAVYPASVYDSVCHWDEAAEAKLSGLIVASLKFLPADAACEDRSRMHATGIPINTKK